MRGASSERHVVHPLETHHLIRLGVELLPRDDLLHHLAEDVPSIAVLRLELRCHAQQLAALPNEIVQGRDLGVVTLVRQVSEAHLFGREMLVQVKELKRRTRRLAQRGGEDSRVERRQWLLKLRRDERQRLVLDVECPEELHSLRDARSVETEEPVVEERREVLGHLFALLQAALDLLCQRLAVWNVMVLRHVRLVCVEGVHRHTGIAAEPPEQHVDELCVLVLV
mmetsp:Transcript_13251/g.26889  ORF Transcript_13251/g.26889 Transcript_13251/m.26889 type:complete len:225 (+) Transcript_13251:122-796(+)